MGSYEICTKQSFITKDIVPLHIIFGKKVTLRDLVFPHFVMSKKTRFFRFYYFS